MKTLLLILSLATVMMGQETDTLFTAKENNGFLIYYIRGEVFDTLIEKRLDPFNGRWSNVAKTVHLSERKKLDTSGWIVSGRRTQIFSMDSNGRSLSSRVEMLWWRDANNVFHANSEYIDSIFNLPDKLKQNKQWMANLIIHFCDAELHDLRILKDGGVLKEADYRKYSKVYLDLKKDMKAKP